MIILSLPGRTHRHRHPGYVRIRIGAVPPPPDAEHRSSNASTLFHAAAERGLRVPQDVSITGFDDIELARATLPRLTTVAQPLQEMGRMAVTQLVRLQGRQKLDALHVELATKLVVRDSTGPAPG